VSKRSCTFVSWYQASEYHFLTLGVAQNIGVSLETTLSRKLFDGSTIGAAGFGLLGFVIIGVSLVPTGLKTLKLLFGISASDQAPVMLLLLPIDLLLSKSNTDFILDLKLFSISSMIDCFLIKY